MSKNIFPLTKKFRIVSVRVNKNYVSGGTAPPI